MGPLYVDTDSLIIGGVLLDGFHMDMYTHELIILCKCTCTSKIIDVVIKFIYVTTRTKIECSLSNY